MTYPRLSCRALLAQSRQSSSIASAANRGDEAPTPTNLSALDVPEKLEPTSLRQRPTITEPATETSEKEDVKERSTPDELAPAISAARIREQERRSAIEYSRLCRAALGEPVRNPWVSVKLDNAPEADWDFYLWHREIAALHRRHDRRLRSPYAEVRAREEQALNASAETWAQEILQDLEESQINFTRGLIDTSRIANINQQPHQWVNVALWLLCNKPVAMMDFLRKTHRPPHPPAYCIGGALEYLIARFSRAPEKHRARYLPQLIGLIVQLADRPSTDKLKLEGFIFRRLLPICTDLQAQRLYKTCKVDLGYVHWNAYLNFASHFAKTGYFELALDAMLAAEDVNTMPYGDAFRSGYATLLRTAMRQPGGYRVCLRLIDTMVKRGMTLNTHLCNIIMLNAVEARDLQTAFTVYRSLTQHGLQANSYTHAILLEGCKSAIDDAEMLNNTIRDAIAHVNVRTEPTLATQILHCLALHHQQRNPGRAFAMVADAYAQLFDVQPLRDLGLPLPQVSEQRPAVEQKITSQGPAMRIMMAMYLEQTSANGSPVEAARRLYRRFRELIDDGVEPFASMLDGDRDMNIFLIAFAKTRAGLLHAANVIKDMQKPDAKCAPTVQSWSIFLHGFAKHGQMRLAEQVLTYMQKRGIQPNEVTWNMLAAGHAGNQDIERTIDTLRRMEADGKTWDGWTIGGLRRLRDQAGFAEAWAETSVSQTTKLDFTPDLKKRLQTKIGSVEEPQLQEAHDVDTGASSSNRAESGSSVKLRAFAKRRVSLDVRLASAQPEEKSDVESAASSADSADSGASS